MSEIITIESVRAFFRRKNKGEKLSPTEIKLTKQYLRHVENSYKRHHTTCCQLCPQYQLYKEAKPTIEYLLA